jgi:hypothetical protein
LAGAHPLVLTVGAALVVAVVLAIWRVRRRRAARRLDLLAPIVRAVWEPFGDAVVLLDPAGRIVAANDMAGHLFAPIPASELTGKDVAVLGYDVTVLWHGVRRGPATADVTIPFGAGPLRARAALVRLASRPPRDLLVLRRGEHAPAEAPPAHPPPLPGTAPRTPGPGEVRAVLGAAAASLRDPLARALAAASYLRLGAPPLAAGAATELARLEVALDDAGRRLGALAAAAERAGGSPRTLDLATLVADLLATHPPPPGVRVRTALRPALAVADDRTLRAALREALRAMVAGAANGELTVAVSGHGAAAVVEIAGGLAPAEDDGAAAVARALVAQHGGTVESDEAPGHARRLRIALPLAHAPAAAPA